MVLRSGSIADGLFIVRSRTAARLRPCADRHFGELLTDLPCQEVVADRIFRGNSVPDYDIIFSQLEYYV